MMAEIWPNKKLEEVILAAIRETLISEGDEGSKILAQHINEKIAKEASKDDSLYLGLYLDLYIAKSP